jgi:hypothetical protein
MFNNPIMNNSQMFGQSPMMGNPYINNGMGNNNMGDGMEQHMFDQMMKDPDAVLQMMETQMPNLSEEHKAMLKTNIELMKKNPELVKQMLGNPAVLNAMKNPMGMNGNPMGMGNGSPYMNPMMNGSNPMLNNSQMFGQGPMMGNGMGNPYINNGYFNPYMNNGFYNPYMMPQQANNQPPPANGPCSHGFYPPKMVNGKPEPQDAEAAYAEKLTALKEMGFYDKEANIKALNDAHGDISEAIDILSKKANNSNK